MTVYLIRADSTPFVKIGLAINTEKRLKELQVGSPHSLSVARTIDGGRKMEAVFHRRFHPLHIRGEWFNFHEDMKTWVPADTDFHGIEAWHRPGENRRSLSASEMILLYQEGLTLNEIGGRAGITRERVRQVIGQETITVERVKRAKEIKIRNASRLAAKRELRKSITTASRAEAVALYNEVIAHLSITGEARSAFSKRVVGYQTFLFVIAKRGGVSCDVRDRVLAAIRPRRRKADA